MNMLSILLIGKELNDCWALNFWLKQLDLILFIQIPMYLLFKLLFIPVFLFSYSSKHTAEETVKLYLQAIDKRDFKGAMQLMVKNETNRNVIANMEKVGNLITGNTSKYNLKEVESHDDKASILVTYFNNDMISATSFFLVKVNNRWLIERIAEGEI